MALLARWKCADGVGLDRCEGVEVMLGLISIDQELGPKEPLETYGTKDRWEV